MKAKVYPLSYIGKEVDTFYSSFCLQFEILCATLARGTSIINGIIDNNEIETTIKWCKQLGASIKKSGSTLTIKGINRRNRLVNNLFTGETAVAPKLFVPIFCTINLPIGVKTTTDINEEIQTFGHIFEAFGVSFYTDNNILRFESVMKGTEIEIDGDTDIYFVGGLMLACSILDSDSIIRLRAPIRNEANYKTVLKILKKFGIDIKHPATMQYEINGRQRIRHCRIRTENDGIQLSHMILLSQLLDGDKEYFRFLKYHQKSVSSDSTMYRSLRNKISNYSRFRNVIRRKTISLDKADMFVDDTLPYLMILGSLNDKDFTINKLDLHKSRNKIQYGIMCRAFKKLGLPFDSDGEQMIVHPQKVLEKKQIDCENDPYVAMALIYLALLSKCPVVIVNVECIRIINSDLFDILKGYGAHIEFIYD